ncbi:mercury transporter MerT [Edaphobacter sp. 4G125]|nr:mercuric transporter MerT family protein [Edaphobacter sp. 4G125]QNI38034.1 mercury transporter MerT [Edaphobacter sp. 4G125]
MRPVLNTKAALVGSVLTGIGASACCVGPLLLLSLGIGGAWITHLTALEPFRPVFIVLTVVFLGLAFRSLYLTPKDCSVGNKCVADQTRNVQRVLFWVLAPVVLIFVASPWILPLLYR